MESCVPSHSTVNFDMASDIEHKNEVEDIKNVHETRRCVKDKKSSCVSRAGRLIKEVNRYQVVSFKNQGTEKEIQRPFKYTYSHDNKKKSCDIKNEKHVLRNTRVTKSNSSNFRPLHSKTLSSKKQHLKPLLCISKHKEEKQKKIKNEVNNKKVSEARNKKVIKNNSGVNDESLRRKMRFVIASVSSYIATMEITISHNWSVIAPQPQDLFEMLDGAENLYSFVENKFIEIKEEKELQSEAENFRSLCCRSKIVVYIIKKLLNRLKDIMNDLVYESTLIEEVQRNLYLIEKFGLKLPQNFSILKKEKKHLSFGDFSVAVEPDSGLFSLQQIKPTKVILVKKRRGNRNESFPSSSLKDEGPPFEGHYENDSNNEYFEEKNEEASLSYSHATDDRQIIDSDFLTGGMECEEKFSEKCLSYFHLSDNDDGNDSGFLSGSAGCEDVDNKICLSSAHGSNEVLETNLFNEDKKCEGNIDSNNAVSSHLRDENKVMKTTVSSGDTDCGEKIGGTYSPSCYVTDKNQSSESNVSNVLKLKEKINEISSLSSQVTDENQVLDNQVLRVDEKCEDVNGKNNFGITNNGVPLFSECSEVSECISLSKESCYAPKKKRGRKKKTDDSTPVSEGYMKNLNKNGLSCEVTEIISISDASCNIPKQKKRGRKKKAEGILLNNQASALSAKNKGKCISKKQKLEAPTERILSCREIHDKSTDGGELEVSETPLQIDVGIDEPVLKMESLYGNEKKEILSNQKISELEIENCRRIVATKTKPEGEREEVILQYANEAHINEQAVVVDNKNLKADKMEVNLDQTSMNDVTTSFLENTVENEKLDGESKMFAVIEHLDEVCNKNDALQTDFVEPCVPYSRQLLTVDSNLEKEVTGEKTLQTLTDPNLSHLKNNVKTSLQEKTEQCQTDMLMQTEPKEKGSNSTSEYVPPNVGLEFGEGKCSKRITKTSKVPVIVNNEGDSGKTGVKRNSVLKSKVCRNNAKNNSVVSRNFQVPKNCKRYKKANILPATNVIESFPETIGNEDTTNDVVALEVEVEDSSLMTQDSSCHNSNFTDVKMRDVDAHSEAKCCVGSVVEAEGGVNSEILINSGLDIRVSNKITMPAENVDLQKTNNENKSDVNILSGSNNSNCSNEKSLSDSNNSDCVTNENNSLFKTLEGIANLLDHPIYDGDILKETISEILNIDNKIQNQCHQFTETSTLLDHDYVRISPIEPQHSPDLEHDVNENSIKDREIIGQPYELLTNNKMENYDREKVLQEQNICLYGCQKNSSVKNEHFSNYKHILKKNSIMDINNGGRNSNKTSEDYRRIRQGKSILKKQNLRRKIPTILGTSAINRFSHKERNLEKDVRMKAGHSSKLQELSLNSSLNNGGAHSQRRDPFLREIKRNSSEIGNYSDQVYGAVANETSKTYKPLIEPMWCLQTEGTNSGVKGSHMSPDHKNGIVDEDYRSIAKYIITKGNNPIKQETKDSFTSDCKLSKTNNLSNNKVFVEYINQQNFMDRKICNETNIKLTSHNKDKNNNQLINCGNITESLNTLESAHSEEVMNTEQFLQSSIDINFSQNTPDSQSSQNSVTKDDFSNISLSSINKRKKFRSAVSPFSSEVNFKDLNW